jgi:hypothetical protein
MGRVKDDEIFKDDNWAALYRRNGWTCQMCGAVPPERDKTFDDNICGQCWYASEKD